MQASNAEGKNKQLQYCIEACLHGLPHIHVSALGAAAAIRSDHSCGPLLEAWEPYACWGWCSLMLCLTAPHCIMQSSLRSVCIKKAQKEQYRRDYPFWHFQHNEEPGDIPDCLCVHQAKCWMYCGHNQGFWERCHRYCRSTLSMGH